MKRVRACGLAVVILLATACTTMPSAGGDATSASPRIGSPNNVEELSGETGSWPTAAGG